ncbi:flagellar biosynthesis protein [Cypionkella aquatica]|uniref:Flagellar biosynthesis protein n=1 Tax=Cypionkella aquatica TaxID=1756042 RepID=A0AA37WYZ8_9RHOB|nr:flagellar biosynthesis protein [Cypionkella aquatica]GLS85204.1 flagellar biosynthesis protein [Cypionkella aquatica]
MVLRLEVFETEQVAGTGKTVVLDALHLEETKLASYDSGYTSGWEDAAAAQAGDQTRVRADLARNLQALSFTFHEARQHVLRALQPLMTEMVGRLLPALARETLAQVVLEALMPIAEKLADTPVTLVLNPASRAALETLLEEATGLPLILTEEPSLSEGQVYLKLGSSETHVNLDRAIAEITAAVHGFFEISMQEKKHG